MINELLIRVVPSAIVLGCLWICELFAEQDIRAKFVHDLQNLLLALLNAGLLFFTLGFCSVFLIDVCQHHQFGLLNWIVLPRPLALIAALLILDLFGYIWHRANHRFAPLWRMHRVHHSDADMNASTAARFHVGELAIAGLVRLPVLALFGISAVQLIVYESLLVAVSLFHHSRLNLGRFDDMLRLIIVTPGMHRVHHSCMLHEQKRNYASVFSIWDRILGTHAGHATVHPMGLDAGSQTNPPCLGTLLMMPLKEPDR
jgi:sterol desaturase/sphingolipid hydroxylase (fatty acid hydroxylase superfamily)